MAELNFGLLTPPGSQSIGNAFVSGMDQGQASQQAARQGEVSQMQLAKLRRDQQGLAEFSRKVASMGGPSDPIEIAKAYLAHPDVEMQKLGAGLMQKAQTLAAYKLQFPDIAAAAPSGAAPAGPTNALAPAAVGAAPVGQTNALALPTTTAAPVGQTNALAPAAVGAAPVVPTATVESRLAEIRVKLARLEPFTGANGAPAAIREADMLKKEAEELLKPQNVAPGNTLLRPGITPYIAPPAPSEFEKLLTDSGLSLAQQQAARVAKIGKDSTTISEFSNVLAQLGRTTDPAERRQLQNRLTYLSTHAPGTNVTVKLPPVEGKYSETFAKNVAEEDIKLLDAARNAPKVMATANRVLELLDKPDIFVGPAATIKLNLARALKVLGATDTEKISNTEKLIAAAGQGTLDAIKGANLGTGQGFTAKDLEFLTAVAGGKIDFTPENLREMARLQQLAAELSVKKWTTRRPNMPGSALKGTGIDKETYELEPRFSPYVETKPLPDGRMLGKKRDGSVEVIK